MDSRSLGEHREGAWDTRQGWAIVGWALWVGKLAENLAQEGRDLVGGRRECA